MKCPFCGFANDKVVDSRESKEADSIRRRRECLKCEKRFTTYERVEEQIKLTVIKKDGRRVPWERGKVLLGLEHQPAEAARHLSPVLEHRRDGTPAHAGDHHTLDLARPQDREPVAAPALEGPREPRERTLTELGRDHPDATSRERERDLPVPGADVRRRAGTRRHRLRNGPLPA